MTFEELQKLRPEDYCLVDIRSEDNAAYGMIPGAIHLPEKVLLEEIGKLPEKKTVILYCARGIRSAELAEDPAFSGRRVESLEGGYMGWLVQNMKAQAALDSASSPQKAEGKAESFALQVEKSIRKKFHKELFTPFARAINDYELLSPGDKVAVCISGGKDSTLMAKLFQELRRHDKFPFELVFLVMDPGYSPVNRKLIEHNAARLDIPVTVFESTIFDAVYTVDKNPCYLCARMRRGYLYNRAKELGCNKIALGHHYDDVIETILMGMLYGGQVQTMMPKLHSTNFEGMELIRPMYLIREEDIIRWRDYNGLQFLQCACRFTDTCTTCDPDGRTVSKRMEIKHLISELKKVNPSVEANIFRSVENVNLSTVICYKQDGVRHSFLENYSEKG